MGLLAEHSCKHLASLPSALSLVLELRPAWPGPVCTVEDTLVNTLHRSTAGLCLHVYLQGSGSDHGQVVSNANTGSSLRS